MSQSGHLQGGRSHLCCVCRCKHSNLNNYNWAVKKANSNGGWEDYEGEHAIDVPGIRDENFRNWIAEQSYGQDGWIIPAEIAAVKVIDVSSKNIASLKGIEYFTALTELRCYNNQLTTLDVSKNMVVVNQNKWNTRLSFGVRL